MAETLTDADVRRIAALARLELSPAEVASLGRQLGDILAYADQLQQVDTTGVPPMSQPWADAPPWRVDVEQPSLDRDAALERSTSASVRTGLFKVPKVL